MQQSRILDGSRKLTSITHVTGLEANEVQMQEVFKFDQRGLDADGKVVGEFVRTGYYPEEVLKRFQVMNVAFDASVFAPPS